MARDEANVKVRINTRQAKSDLRGLTKDATAAAGRVGGTVRGALGRGLGFVGLGGGIGVGLAAIRGATESGVTDVITESLGGIGARLSRALLNNLSVEARADKRAREETIRAFAVMGAGPGGAAPAGANNFFNAIRAIRLQEEQGRRSIEEDPNMRSSSIEKLAEQVSHKIAIHILVGASQILQGLKSQFFSK